MRPLEITPARLLITGFWMAFANAVAGPLALQVSQGGVSLEEGLGANLVVWFAGLVGTVRLWSLDREVTGYWTGALILAGLVCIAVPMAMASWAAAVLMGAGLACLARKRMDRYAGMLMAMAALREPLTSLSLKLFAGPILGADAALAGTLLALMGESLSLEGNIVTTASGETLLILTGCSVFTNLSYASLLWLALRVHLGAGITRGSLFWLLGLCVMAIGANALRLALMSRSVPEYVFYHDGLGSELFLYGIFAASLLVSLASCHHARR